MTWWMTCWLVLKRPLRAIRIYRLGKIMADMASDTHWKSAALTVGVPLAAFAVKLMLWEFLVWYNEVPVYKLPAPSIIFKTLIKDWGTLYPSFLITMKITLLSLLTAVVAGVALAIAFTRSRWVELSFTDVVVFLQVTPLIAIAPLLIIYFGENATVYIAAVIVAFFPILSNTMTGLRSTDHGLVNLFDLYGATPWQKLTVLQLRNALPYFLTGLRIASGLALIGAIVAEFVAGTAGNGTGLAFRILESGYRLNIPRLFAALVLVSLSGVILYFGFAVLTHVMLRKWHESAIKQER
jgi:NitT/TauT family transport system permease protein